MKQKTFDLVKSVETPVIVVTKRTHDYMAILKDHPEIWGCGENIYSAMGNLISAHPEFFNVKIEYPKAKP